MQNVTYQIDTTAVSKIFLFENYRQFLKSQIDKNCHVRGYQARMAEAAGCSHSYMSRALSGHVQLTPEQAFGLAKYLDLTHQETEFFLHLLYLSRAGTVDLRSYLLQQITKLRKDCKQEIFANES